MKGFKKMETGIMIFKIREASGTGTLAFLAMGLIYCDPIIINFILQNARSDITIFLKEKILTCKNTMASCFLCRS